jgi:hypothetical protein
LARALRVVIVSSGLVMVLPAASVTVVRLALSGACSVALLV